MRPVLLTAALLVLAACGREDPAHAPQPPTAPTVPSAPQPPEPPAPPAGVASSRLTMVDAGGAPTLYLFCGNRAGDLVIHAPGLTPIASEDRLTLGAGDEAFAFAADLEAPGPGVTGAGVPEADLFARMARGEPVRAVYGAQTVGPVQAETPAALGAFIARCGGLGAR